MDRYAEPRRHLELEGAVNVRDLGGYATSDGGSIRWKTLLRADNVGSLPPSSQAALIEYGVRTVIDLRRDSQLQASPNVFAGSPEVAFYHRPMIGDETPEELAASSDLARSWLERIESMENNTERKTAAYCIRLDTRQPQIGQTLSTLAAPRTLPALFHCVGGQDRTGIIAALLLGIAGVPVETIVEDYALTAYYRWRGSLAERGVREPHDGASPESFDAEGYRPFKEAALPQVMLGTLQHLEDRYGGVERYVLDTGVTLGEVETLRRSIVE